MHITFPARTRFEIVFEVRIVRGAAAKFVDHGFGQWRAAQIYASRILSFPPNLSASAIDICRTHAALGKAAFNGPQWECLFHAGTVLGPLERSWILEQCKAIAAKMTVLVPLVRNMEMVWQEYRGDWNAFGKLYHGGDDTWFR